MKENTREKFSTFGWGITIIGLLLWWVLSGCSAAWHLNKAVEKDPSLMTHKLDTVERLVTTPGVKKDSTIYSKEYDTVYITKEKLKMKYVNLPGDTAYIEGECLPDTVKVYDIVDKEVYKIPPTYKAFIKEFLGINNFQFWLLHTIIGLGVVLGVTLKFIK